MIRKAVMADLEGVLSLYAEMHDAQEAGLICTNWIRGIYPSRATALAALERDDLFVTEEGGRIIASGIINQAQLGIYAGAAWEHPVPAEQVCVLHTLMVSPAESGKGHARGCPELRIDTSEINAPARAMYRKHGYKEIGIARSELSGIPDVSLVMLEKYLG